MDTCYAVLEPILTPIHTSPCLEEPCTHPGSSREVPPLQETGVAPLHPLVSPYPHCVYVSECVSVAMANLLLWQRLPNLLLCVVCVPCVRVCVCV